MAEETHTIRLAPFDEARATYLEELAELSPEEARRRGEPEPTPDRAAEYQRAAQAIREAAEHAADWVEILHYRPFGAVLDMQAAAALGNFAGRTPALLRNAIVAWSIGGKQGKAMTDEEIRRLDGDLGQWIADEVSAHYEEVRRSAPKATTTSS